MSDQSHPNVVFILADNVGWGDIGCYGLAPTPRIDTLASQGVRFKNYNVEAQCTPRPASHYSPMSASRRCTRPGSIIRSSQASRAAATTRTRSPSWTSAPARFWTRSIKRVLPRIRSSSGAVTTRRDDRLAWAAQTGRGAVTSDLASKAACAQRRSCAGQARCKPALSRTRY